MLPVKREVLNEYDRFAVAIWKDEEVVGHVPKALSEITSFFLTYDGNVVFLRSHSAKSESRRRTRDGGSLGL